MRVLTDKDVRQYLDSTLSIKSIVEEFQPVLLRGLETCRENSDRIIPPRIAQPSNRDDSDTVHLFMPCISPNEVGIKVISGGAGNNAKGLGFQGTVLLLDEITGATKAVVNASTLTAFRTALASTVGLTRTIALDSDILPEITVFGVGAQAYWHVKLALILYQGKVTTVNVVNRTLEKAHQFVDHHRKEFGGVQFNAFSYQHDEREMAPHVRNSSIIFGCIPSTEPTIKKSYVNTDPKYAKFISLIGSYKPHMIELDLEWLKLDFKDKIPIIVDSKEHTLHEAGELIQSGIGADGLVELTELGSETRLATSTNVTVQKLVGLAIMDMSIANYIAERVTGTEIDF